MKFTLSSAVLVIVAGSGLAIPSTGMGSSMSMTSTTLGVSASIKEKESMIKGHLDEAVKLLKEVGQEDAAFGKPLERATAAIQTLDNAIANTFTVYNGNGTRYSRGSKSGGPRYGGYKAKARGYRL